MKQNESLTHPYPSSSVQLYGIYYIHRIVVGGRDEGIRFLQSWGICNKDTKCWEKATKSSLKINILRSSFVLVNVKRRNSKKIRRLMIAYTRKFVFTHVAVQRFFYPTFIFIYFTIFAFYLRQTIKPISSQRRNATSMVFYFIIISI